MISVYLKKVSLSNRRIIKEKDQQKVFLLNKALRDRGVLPPKAFLTEQDLARTSGKKPFLPGFPQIRFNFSHSGEYLALAVSDEEVGLDLQETETGRGDPLKIAKRFFTDDEHRALLSCRSQEEKASLFYLLWTTKEAYLKYLGCGLAGRMDSFRPDPLPGSGQTIAGQGAESLGCFRPESVSGSGQPRAGQSAENMGGFRSKTLPISGLSPAERSSEGMDWTVCRPDPGRIPQLAALFSDKDRRKEDRSFFENQLPADSYPFHAAEYAVLPAPEGYFMTVCARKIPDEIRIRRLDF